MTTGIERYKMLEQPIMKRSINVCPINGIFAKLNCFKRRAWIITKCSQRHCSNNSNMTVYLAPLSLRIRHLTLVPRVRSSSSNNNKRSIHPWYLSSLLHIFINPMMFPVKRIFLLLLLLFFARQVVVAFSRNNHLFLSRVAVYETPGWNKRSIRPVAEPCINIRI